MDIFKTTNMLLEKLSELNGKVFSLFNGPIEYRNGCRTKRLHLLAKLEQFLHCREILCKFRLNWSLAAWYHLHPPPL
jgi:hypothetical protein